MSDAFFIKGGNTLYISVPSSGSGSGSGSSSSCSEIKNLAHKIHCYICITEKILSL
jgi:hypothetical protein